MEIKAAMVKELRERTGAGMMECKKALVESNGDMDAAVELLRKLGQAKADKKAARIAAEGLISIELSADGKSAAISEVNCETDFVAKEQQFIDFCQAVTQYALAEKQDNVESIAAATMPNSSATFDSHLRDLVAKIGEKMSLRRVALLNSDANIGFYQHGKRIGVLVEYQGGDEQLGKDLAMHIAASRPVCINKDQVSKDLLDKEKEIFTAQAKESGKPDNIIEKMIEGRLKKYVNEITLLGQPFVKNPDQNVEKLLKEKGAEVKSFMRFEVGEGIEKKSENFADEVMKQVRGD